MIRLLAVAAGLWVAAVHAAPPPVEVFARRHLVRNLAISPDGSRIAYIVASGDRSFAMVAPRDSPDTAWAVMDSKIDDFDLLWCKWASDKRLLCSLRRFRPELKSVTSMLQLAAVNADGSNLRLLTESAETGAIEHRDGILDWTPDEPDSVVVQSEGHDHTYPVALKLNVESGLLTLLGTPVRPPALRGLSISMQDSSLRHFIGLSDSLSMLVYQAQIGSEHEWRQLAKTQAFKGTGKDAGALEPIAVAPGTRAYAIGAFEGRSALWSADLTGQRPPQLVFSHPLTQVDQPLFTPDGRLVGVGYELGRPFMYYPAANLRAAIQSVNALRPENFNVVSDYSRDERFVVIRSYSDVDAGSFLLLDVRSNQLTSLGRQYPELDAVQLGRMRSIAYAAADGTEIPGYLTAPPGVRAEKLPLIVMPHGGPVVRDSWEYDMLRAFLVSRGYAVLQMKPRGWRYGTWLDGKPRDWDGAAYSDIADGARWAVEKGVADPARMCIVGWGVGGYAALLGAVRDPILFKCSASIAGMTDLNRLLYEGRYLYFTAGGLLREQNSVHKDALRGASPLDYADKIAAPVLLVHGDRDYQVYSGHSRRMAAALRRAGKPHRAVFIEGATHQLERESDRRTLLTELEKFLIENLGPATLDPGLASPPPAHGAPSPTITTR